MEAASRKHRVRHTGRSIRAAYYRCTQPLKSPKVCPEVVRVQLESSGGKGPRRRSRQVPGRRSGDPPAASVHGPVEQSQVQLHAMIHI